MIDEQFAEWEGANDVKQCPKCRARIEKNLGCNHMTCSVCHYQFCWLCENEYYDGHYSPFNPIGCPGLQFALEDPDAIRPGFFSMWILRMFLVPLFIIAFGIAIGLAAVALGLATACFIPIVCHRCGLFSYLKKYFYSEPPELARRDLRNLATINNRRRRMFIEDNAEEL